MDYFPEIEPSLLLPHERIIKPRPSTLLLPDLCEEKQPRHDLPTPDSGYTTRNISPDCETPPVTLLDFENICKKLEPISSADSKVEVKSESSPLSDAFVITKPSPDLLQYVGQPCIFWIRNERQLDFDCHVTGPFGIKCSVKSELQLDLGQFKMSFVPIESGIYTINVLSKSTQFEVIDKKEEDLKKPHLLGSPFEIIVYRNYALASFGNPIVSIDMEQSECQDMIIGRKPWGITTNPKEEQIIVTDREHHQVLIYSADGTLTSSFGDFGSRTGQFKRPTGITFDSIKDRLYVTDKDNHRVQIFTSTGSFIYCFGRRGKLCGQFNFPWGISVSKCGEMLVVADSRNHRLQLFNADDGQFLRKFSDCGTYFDYPRGVDFDATGKYIYATDFNLHHVLRMDINFTTCERIIDDTQLKRPQGIHIDSNGLLMVSSSRQNCIKIFNPQNGNLLQEITSVNDSDLDLPLNMITLYAGYLATLDLNGRISIF